MAYTAHPTVITGQTWTASNQNTYVRDNFIAGVPDIFTTKGDIVVASGADVAIRLGVGSDEQILIACSTESGGIKWANICAQVNLSAAGITPDQTNGCAEAETKYGTTYGEAYKVAAFSPGTAVEQQGQWNFPLPEDYNGGTLKAMVFWQHEETTHAKVAWSIQGAAVAQGELFDKSWGTAIQVNDEGGSAGKLYVSDLSSDITFSGTPAAGKKAFVRIMRKTSDTTNDNCEVDAQLIDVLLFYKRG